MNYRIKTSAEKNYDPQLYRQLNKEWNAFLNQADAHQLLEVIEQDKYPNERMQMFADIRRFRIDLARMIKSARISR